MSEELASIFENAADHMEAHGWTTGQQQDEDGHVCLQGAIHYGNKGVLNRSLYDAAGRALTALLGQTSDVNDRLRQCSCPACSDELSWLSITMWNDKQCHSQQEALDLLRKAAKMERT